MPVRLEIPSSPSLTSTWVREGYLLLRGRGVEGVLEGLTDELNGLLVGNDWNVLQQKFGEGRVTNIVALAKHLAFQSDEEVVITSVVKPGYQAIGSTKFVQGPRTKVRNEGFSLQLLKLERYEWVTALELGAFGRQVTPYADRYAIFLLLAGLASTYTVRTRKGEYIFLLCDSTTLSSMEGKEELVLIVKESAKEALRRAVRELRGWNEEYITLRVVFNEQFINRAKFLELKSLGFRMVRVRSERHSLKVYGDTPLMVFLERDIYRRKEFLGRINNALSRLAAPLSSYLQGRDQSGDGYHAFRALKNLYMYYETGAPVFLAQYNREVHAMAEALPQGDARRRREYLCAVL
uniref:Uncharacterized protein n=1 Tax=Thermofilum pendens TaxID=2269 RepID=A0A7C4BA17_THEPE